MAVVLRFALHRCWCTRRTRRGITSYSTLSPCLFITRNTTCSRNSAPFFFFGCWSVGLVPLRLHMGGEPPVRASPECLWRSVCGWGTHICVVLLAGGLQCPRPLRGGIPCAREARALRLPVEIHHRHPVAQQGRAGPLPRLEVHGAHIVDCPAQRLLRRQFVPVWYLCASATASRSACCALSNASRISAYSGHWSSA